jgi:hypothetical protein
MFFERSSGASSVPRRLLVAVLLTLLAALVAVPVAAAAKRRVTTRAVLTLTKLTASDARLSVAGRVTLPRGSALKRARVAFTLTDAKRGRERFSVALDARRAFKLTRATKLTGRLALVARVTLGGTPSGRAVSRSLTVKPATRRPGGSGGGTTTTPGGGTTTPSTNTPPPAPLPVPAGATPLKGLFTLDEGRQAISGRLSGSWFRMLGGAGFSPLPNGDSPFLDTTYTPLRPGSDGGLSTVGYQPPPAPPFARRNADGSPTGNALAARLTQPQTFFGVHFSIVTDATDPQTAQSDPLPAIAVKDGTLSGQTTAWAAQWNGQSFNQGTPKPDGSFAGLPGITPALDRAAGTVALSGTYDAATSRYTLDWQSLIVGGPFDSYTGRWHLEGTFVPAG